MLGILKPETVTTKNIQRISEEVIQEFYDLSSVDLAGLVSRALDRMGMATTIPASILEPVQSGRFLVGQAVTVRNLPIQTTPYQAWQSETASLLGEREAFFLAQTGDVIVIDGSSVYPASCLGSMAVNVAAALGVGGIVVDGAITGLSGIRSATIPVWSRSGTTITGHHRVETIEINGPIGIHGVRVNPGDLVVADDSGVTFVPYHLIQTTLEEARNLSRKNQRVQEALAAGATRETLRTAITDFVDQLSKR